MSRHFTEVSSVYRDVRTTDPEPVAQIAEELRGPAGVEGADIGCGDGRYDLLLFQAIPGLRLTCVDANAAMLRHAAELLSGRGFDGFDIRRSRVEDPVLEPGAYRFVCSFNAVHHFDFPDFLRTSRDGLADGGHLFVYTRLPEHNARGIWGRCFPGFRDKETRLLELADMHRWIERTERLRFVSATCFRYARRASLERLVEQARSWHYSTFSLYQRGEFERALAGFEANLRRRFVDPEAIEWHDENILIHARRSAD